MFVLVGLPACTTVDLSQVAVQSEAIPAVQEEKNVVERASLTLTSVFRDKGWCSGGPQEKTQTATSVLLNGVKATPASKQKSDLTFKSEEQLAAALAVANEHVVKTTKAAEVFLSMTDEMADVDSELSLLETALLSAREAKTRFDKAAASSQSSVVRQDFQTFQASVISLKAITDQYGDHARTTIANKSMESRS
ncbi:MAG: hypothetical protein EX271_13405 [Acidimicrobiales bacterium]|nr:hypothetical protein [Hyphomonadaceae bacterium]RZV34702.1 MAG: hypothetical protein EX271_13405 [Acidimicrobiales bacterium]